LTGGSSGNLQVASWQEYPNGREGFGVYEIYHSLTLMVTYLEVGCIGCRGDFFACTHILDKQSIEMDSVVGWIIVPSEDIMARSFV